MGVLLLFIENKLKIILQRLKVCYLLRIEDMI